jgi:molybdopterin synthase sulfur carrier subunit
MPATVTVRYWAGAQRAAGLEHETLTAATIGELRSLLSGRAGLAQVVEVASFLVDGRQAGEATALHDGAEVDVLPPFAGGAQDVARHATT